MLCRLAVPRAILYSVVLRDHQDKIVLSETWSNSIVQTEIEHHSVSATICVCVFPCKQARARKDMWFHYSGDVFGIKGCLSNSGDKEKEQRLPNSGSE